MRTHSKPSLGTLLVLTVSFGCQVGGSSSAGGGSDTSSGGAGGSGASCIKVNCLAEVNQTKPECDYSAEPGTVGDGPPFLGSSPDLGRGFLEGGTLYVAYDSGSGDGAIFAVDASSGERSFVSGVLEDPQTGPQPRGSGPAIGTSWDVARGANGALLVLTDNDMGRQILSVDEATGDRELVVSLATPPCMVGEETAQIDPQLEVLSSGNIALIGSANGGAGLFEIEFGTGECSIISFASDDENAVGSGPLFYDFRSFALRGGKAYVTDSASSSLLEIDLETGARLRLSSSSGATPVGEGPFSGTESILVSEEFVHAARESFSSGVLVRTSLSTGDRTEFLPTAGPIDNASQPWLYGEDDGCFYFGAGHTVYVFELASGVSNRISR